MVRSGRLERPVQIVQPGRPPTGPEPTRFWGQWSIALGVLTFTSGLFLLLMFISIGLGGRSRSMGPDQRFPQWRREPAARRVDPGDQPESHSWSVGAVRGVADGWRFGRRCGVKLLAGGPTTGIRAVHSGIDGCGRAPGALDALAQSTLQHRPGRAAARQPVRDGVRRLTARRPGPRGHVLPLRGGQRGQHRPSSGWRRPPFPSFPPGSWVRVRGCVTGADVGGFGTTTIPFALQLAALVLASSAPPPPILRFQ